MMKTIPDGFQSVTPVFILKDARKAIEFYKRAFDAKEQFLMPRPDGKGVLHAEIRIGTSVIMLGDESPQQPCRSAETLGGSPVNFYVYVEDADRSYRRALEAGAQGSMPVQEMFWGDRVGTVLDPFGYSWTLATRVRELSHQEIQEGADEAYARYQQDLKYRSRGLNDLLE